jgi:hypothetical protein
MPNDSPKPTNIKSYIDTLDKPYVDYDFTDVESKFNDDVLYDFIVKEFAKEFELNINSAIKVINSMCLLEVLIERYWNKFYKLIRKN